MIGVSPAYFLSLYGPGFGPADIDSGLPFLARTGYKSFQAEVFLESALSLWTEASTNTLVDSVHTKGLHCNTFVAHFLGTVFTSSSSLSQGFSMDQVKAALAIAASVTSSHTSAHTSSATAPIPAPRDNSLENFKGRDRFFVLPLLAFTQPYTPETGARFRDLIGTLSTLCRSSDLHLALELVPGNILGGSKEFLNLVAEPGFADLRLLFDTGHFWAMREPVQDLPRTLGSHIVATHLCDNDGIVNLSLCPGAGTIPFPALLKALGESRYQGSLDLEIVCSKDAVETEYHHAYTQFKHMADQTSALQNRPHAAGHHTNLQPYKETI